MTAQSCSTCGRLGLQNAADLSVGKTKSVIEPLDLSNTKLGGHLESLGVVEPGKGQIFDVPRRDALNFT